jgi:hypothetical protein
LSECSRRLRRTRRQDHDGATRNADEAVRDAAEEGGLERAAAARADDEQFGVLLVREIGEALGRDADGGAALGRDEAGRRLEEAGRNELRGRLGIANAKLAYQQYKELFHGERWDGLAALGATAQRCLWASTSVKDPSVRDTLYVEELIGPETISTMPEETIRAFQDHGRVEPRLEKGLEGARYLFNQLYAAGVDSATSSPHSSAKESTSSLPRSTSSSAASPRSGVPSAKPRSAKRDPRAGDARCRLVDVPHRRSHVRVPQVALNVPVTPARGDAPRRSMTERDCRG